MRLDGGRSTDLGDFVALAELPERPEPQVLSELEAFPDTESDNPVADDRAQEPRSKHTIRAMDALSREEEEDMLVQYVPQLQLFLLAMCMGEDKQGCLYSNCFSLAVAAGGAAAQDVAA